MWIRAVPLGLLLLFVACSRGGGGGDRDPVDGPCEGVVCGDHGACTAIDGQGVCECDPGYTGEACGDCSEGWVPVDGSCVADACKDVVCGDHGACVADNGVGRVRVRPRVYR